MEIQSKYDIPDGRMSKTVRKKIERKEKFREKKN